MLLNTKGYYWDDWGLLGDFDFHTMNRQFVENGNIWYGYFEWIFISLQPYGIFAFRIFTFCAFFACGCMLYQILKPLQILKTYELFFITLLFLLLPFNTISRNILINAPYTLCYLLFFTGFYLLSRSVAQSESTPLESSPPRPQSSQITLARTLTRILTLTLFFVSFTMNSLLIFYALPLAYLLYTTRSYTRVRAFLNFLARHIDFLILPLLFYALKMMFFKPYGLYEGYNAISAAGFFKAFIKVPLFSLSHLIQADFLLLGGVGLLATFGALCVLAYRLKAGQILKRDIWGLGVGFLIMWAGMFSYVVVFKYASFGNIEDRFSILESLGCGVVVVFFINLLARRLALKLTLLLCLALGAIGYNISAQQTVFLAYVRQVGVFSQLMTNPIFLSHDTFRVYGDVNRDISDNSFYQLNGIYFKLSGKSDKHISPEEQATPESRALCKAWAVYGCSEYRGDIEHYGRIYITNKRAEQKSAYNFLADMRLYLLHLFAPTAFLHKAQNRYEVAISPPPES